VNLTRWLALTLFLSAFLLFCLQPMVGKMLLPSLGGAASVWTTCVLFFQAMLLAGYFYAYLLGKFFGLRGQLIVHLVVTAAAFIFLPVQLDGSSAPAGGASPIAWELLQLLRNVALPFFVVSTTAPLLQSWLTKTHDEAAQDPYFLYAASNAGSLLSLILYPFVFEPRLGVNAQSLGWLAGFGLLVLMVVVVVAVLWRSKLRSDVPEASSSPTARTRVFWLVSSFVPSALMLAVTTNLSVNLATVPFLWTLPLAVYLLTFILAFGRRLRVSAAGISRVSPALLLLLIPIFAAGPVRQTILYFGLLSAHLLLLLVGGLLCHTALAESRPKASHLTEYYAWIAVGGALGGLFAAIIAPVVFSTVLEYPLLAATLAFFRRPQETRRNVWDLSFPVLVAAVLAAGWGIAQWRGYTIKAEHIWAVLGYVLIAFVAFAFHRRRWFFASGLTVLILIGAFSLAPAVEQGERLYVARDFFGVKKVILEVRASQRKLLHGDTMHGLEALDPNRIGKPLSYYYPTGPLGDVITMMRNRPDQHMGVVGLGSGTIAAYGQPNRHITFFEIDPQVEFIARHYFTYLPRCGKDCDVVLGDGRLSILQAPDKEFDLLILDAFNSDAIPAHLLSREALAIYKRKLKPDGAVLFHVSNRYLRVGELVSALAIDAGLPAMMRIDDDDSELGKSRSAYVVVALEAPTIRTLAEDPNWLPVTRPETIQPWSDDYSNLWAILKWR
jgi:SAM-dependent methyltransferase